MVVFCLEVLVCVYVFGGRSDELKDVKALCSLVVKSEDMGPGCLDCSSSTICVNLDRTFNLSVQVFPLV